MKKFFIIIGIVVAVSLIGVGIFSIKSKGAVTQKFEAEFTKAAYSGDVGTYDTLSKDFQAKETKDQWSKVINGIKSRGYVKIKQKDTKLNDDGSVTTNFTVTTKSGDNNVEVITVEQDKVTKVKSFITQSNKRNFKTVKTVK